MRDEIVANLCDLLDEERRLLLAGNLAAVNEISVRKNDLITQLVDSAECGEVELTKLRTRANRNHTMLEASLAGVQAARTRLAEVRCAASQLDTYTGAGRIRNLIDPRSHVTRRA